MRILFMGTPDFAAVSLEKLYEGGYDVCGVFTQPDRPKNRGMKLVESPVKTVAKAHGTAVYQPAKLRDGTALEIIREIKPDLIAVVAYGRILPKDILDYPKYGCINIHGSILPKYRGAAPIQWAVINGEKETGVTAMYLAEEMDSGDIIAVRKTEIGPNETAGELFDRLAVMGGELLCQTVDSIADGTAKRTPQNNAEATYAPPLTKDMCPIDWEMKGVDIVNKIRGMIPSPVATADLNGKVFKIFKAETAEYNGEKHAGEIVSADKNGIKVVCGDGAVVITELQAAGGKRMRAADYLRGHTL